ncbi:S24 family peptidase [Xanthocytophaga flava]|uniref:S24 family peptidase n=1 Tax=Xanthocytophaga flava TaxID=3048013 RepID=UPI0028D865F5|nr:S24 family peptidase [Xanthocytophaga flavus]MDJ1466605.1 S24 family peptidase [Xanthocytophaga flavus]
MENLHARLKHCRVKLGLNQQTLSQRVKINQKDVSLIEAGKRKYIPEEYFLYLSSEGIDLNWLYTGKGEMYLKDTLQKYNSKQEGIPAMSSTALSAPLLGKSTLQLVTVDKQGDSVIAMVPIKAAAGYIMYCHRSDYLEELSVFSLPDFRSGNYRAFEIWGDSMEHTIYSQDWVIGERLEMASQLRDGAIYIIVTSGNIVCKRVVNRLDRLGHLVLRSDNTEYEDQILEPNDIIEVWLVKARITRDFRSARAALVYFREEVNRLDSLLNGMVHKQ